MSLPPGFLDELRNRVSLTQVVGRKVAWDQRKSNRGKGDMWAPCPFHQEKSASFHVDDAKGFYYCFGCHAKGDAISFVKETENVGFMEAVEILAREAGMPMPERSPRDVAVADRRQQLADVMEQAARFFRMQLRSAAGTQAREVLARRRLSEAGQDRFGIGYAPDSRTALWSHLVGAGVKPELIVESGMAIAPDDGGSPYDRFRGRIMFPIRDARGRCIAFGGRAMDPNARAKYLNSPETPLFDKGRNLYNIGPAREAAGKRAPLIVAEGYMDVIALVEAGFAGAVAPLGTAVTEDQLRLMWRMSDEPVIALDGDAAGIRAALRVVDLALPLIEAGKSLRFCVLPDGQDPDDLIRAEGAGAMQKVLDHGQPMVSLLWRRETEGRVFDSPERRAALDKTLRSVIQTIRDPSIRRHYAEEVARLREGLFGPPKTRDSARREAFVPFPRHRRGQRPPLAIEPTAGARASLLATADGVEDDLREAVILATLCTHPVLLPRFESDLEATHFRRDVYRQIAQALLRHGHDDPEQIRAKIDATAGAALENLMSLSHVQIAPPVRNAGDIEMATMCLAEEFAKLEARRGIQKEIEDAVEDIDGLADEGLTWRLGQAAEALNRAGKFQNEDASDLGEDSAAMSRHLQSLIDKQIWVKKGR